MKGLLAAGNYLNEHATGQAGKPFFFFLPWPESIACVVRLDPWLLCQEGVPPWRCPKGFIVHLLVKRGTSHHPCWHPGPLREELLAEATELANCGKASGTAAYPLVSSSPCLSVSGPQRGDPQLTDLWQSAPLITMVDCSICFVTLVATIPAS